MPSGILVVLVLVNVQFLITLFPKAAGSVVTLAAPYLALARVLNGRQLNSMSKKQNASDWLLDKLSELHRQAQEIISEHLARLHK